MPPVTATSPLILRWQGLLAEARSGRLSSQLPLVAGVMLCALMGWLPHHSAHHAFPWIPSARLPQASRRITAVLQRHGAEALPQAASYGQALGWLWREGHFSPPPPAGRSRA